MLKTAQIKQSHLITALSIVFFVTAVSFIFSSGWKTCTTSSTSEEDVCSIGISGYHFHDAVWHIAIAKTAFSSWPPSHPIFAGETLRGYNYYFDILLFLIDKTFGIDPLNGYFHVFPIITSLLYVFSVFYFVERFGFNNREKVLVSLFLFLGNSFAFIMTLFTNGTLAGSSVRGFPIVLSLQPLLMFYNHQYALSLPIILLAITILKNSKESIRKYVLLGAIVSILTGLKVYAGFSVLIILLLYKIIKARITNIIWTLIHLAILFSFFIFTILFIGGGGRQTFSYDPLAFVRSLIDDPSHLYNQNIALARTTLESSGRFSPRLFVLYSAFTIMWYVINFGPRLVLITQFPKMFTKKYAEFNLALLISIIILAAIPLIFLQKGDWWNTIQFMYYAVFLSNILAGVSLAAVDGHKKYVVYIILLATMLIPLIDQINYSLNAERVVIKSEFIEAAEFLSKQEKGSVTTFGSVSGDSRIPAFSGRSLAIADIPVLTNTFVDYKGRQDEMEKYGYVKSSEYILVDKSMISNWQAKLERPKIIFENVQYVIFVNDR